MKKIIFYFLIFLFIFQGCATTTHITSKKGTIEIGMTKTEVLAIWGEPQQKHIFSEVNKRGRYETWSYDRTSWWGAHTIDLQFDKEGELIFIEPLYK